MKKINIFLVFTLTLFTIYSCDTGCNDCEPNNIKKTYFQNKTDNNLRLIFVALDYRNGGNLIPNEEINIEAHSLIKISTLITPESFNNGLLSFTPTTYDSVYYYINDSLTESYSLENCNESKNPLCENNYITTKNETDKDGNTITEKVLVIE